MNNFNYFSVTSVAVFLGQLDNPEKSITEKYSQTCVSRSGSQTAFTWSLWVSHGLLVNAFPEVGWPPVPICLNWAVPRMWDFLCFNPNRDSPKLTTELLWIASAQQSALKPAVQEIILNTQKPNIYSTSYRNGLLKELETSFERWSKRGFSSVWMCWIVPDVEVEQLPPSLQPRWHQRRCSFILGKK